MAVVNSFAKFYGANYPAETDVLNTAPTYGDAINVLDGTADPGGGTTPNYPAEAEVLSGVSFGTDGAEEFTGNFQAPLPADVRDGKTYGSLGSVTGTLDLPAVSDVRLSVSYDNATKTGDVRVPPINKVELGYAYDTGDSLAGTLDPGGAPDYPVPSDVRDGTVYDSGNLTGTLDLPVVGDVRLDVVYDGLSKTGTLDVYGEANLPDATDVRAGVVYGDGSVGLVALPAVGNVRDTIQYGASGEFTGVLDIPAIADVRLGVEYDNATKTGTLDIDGEANIPSADDVIEGVTYGEGNAVTGVYHPPEVNEVWNIVNFGPNSSLTGTNRLPAQTDVRIDVLYGPDDSITGGLDVGGEADYPTPQNVRDGVVYGSGAFTGNVVIPSTADVRNGVEFDTTILPEVGTLDVESEANLPLPSQVKVGVQFGPSNAYVGTVTQPLASQVLIGVSYGAGGDEFTGTLEVTGGGDITPIYPNVQDVRIGVEFGNLGDVPYVGVYEPANISVVKENESYGAYGAEFYGEYVCGGEGDCPPNWIG